MNNNPLKQQASALRRKAAEQSVQLFAQIYLSEHLKYELSAAHVEIYGEIDSMISEPGGKLALAGPRIFGKSTTVTLNSILYEVCYTKAKFIVIVSSTEIQAIKILNNIKKELTENQKIKEDFPEIFEQNGKPKPPRWTRK